MRCPRVHKIAFAPFPLRQNTMVSLFNPHVCLSSAAESSLGPFSSLMTHKLLIVVEVSCLVVCVVRYTY